MYNELRYRGYRVDVGSVEAREGDARKRFEVDFVANKGSMRYYVQSAYAIPADEKLAQETRSLDAIPDSFKKIVVVNRSIVPRHAEKGCLVLSLADFLLNADRLEW